MCRLAAGGGLSTTKGARAAGARNWRARASGATMGVAEGVFHGKYRGTVLDNKDPLKLGRVKARVPDVFGDNESGWALPCAPFGGSGVGFFAVPAIGAGVWIEFEAGNPDYPIWSGCWWGAMSELPPEVLAATGAVMLKTEGGHSILIDDTPATGGITLQTASGQRVSLTAQGIEIDDGQGAVIKLTGPQAGA
jgi:uncharacterized protein involved in type VI secretion and phage assembly